MGPIFHHGIEDGQELPHTGHDGDFERFAGLNETVIKGANDGIIPGGIEGRHI